MTFNWGRVGAILQKEVRDYRRNRFILFTMAILPLIFITLPMLQLFAVNPAPRADVHVGISLLYMFIIPAIIPSFLSAYSVVGEREQGTLEPVLTTPIHRVEFLVGKALAVFLPTLCVAYAIFGIFFGATAVFAHPAIASAVLDRSHILVQLLFTPLVAGWSIWVGIAISTRVSDVRAAQQLSVLASLPPLAVVALMQFHVIAPSLGFALGVAGGLLAVDGLACRVVVVMFGRERLIAGGEP